MRIAANASCERQGWEGDDRDREFWLSLASTWTALAIGIDYVGEAADRMRTRGGVEGGAEYEGGGSKIPP